MGHSEKLLHYCLEPMEIKPACHQILNTALDLIESFASIFNEHLVCLMWWLHNYEYEFVLCLGHIGSNAMTFNYHLSRNYKKQAAKLENAVNYSLFIGLKSPHLVIHEVSLRGPNLSSWISPSTFSTGALCRSQLNTNTCRWLRLAIKWIKILILNVQQLGAVIVSDRNEDEVQLLRQRHEHTQGMHICFLRSSIICFPCTRLTLSLSTQEPRNGFRKPPRLLLGAVCPDFCHPDLRLNLLSLPLSLPTSPLLCSSGWLLPREVTGVELLLVITSTANLAFLPCFVLTKPVP